MRIIFLHTFLIDGFFALQIAKLTIDVYFQLSTKSSQCHNNRKSTNFLDYMATLPENWPHFLITYDQRPTFWILTKGQKSRNLYATVICT